MNKRLTITLVIIAILILFTLLLYRIFRPQPADIYLIEPNQAILQAHPLTYDVVVDISGLLTLDYEEGQPVGYYLITPDGPIVQVDDTGLEDMVGSDITVSGIITYRGQDRVPVIAPETVTYTPLD